MFLKKMFVNNSFLRKSLFLLPFIFNNAFAVGPSIEQRARKVIDNYEQLYRSNKGIQKAVLKNRIINEKEKSRIGNEVTAQIRLVGFENVSSNIALYKSSNLAISYDVNSKLIPLSSFNFFDYERHSGNLRDDQKDKVKVKMFIVEVGKKFKVLDFLDNDNSGFDKLFVMSDSANKKYVIRSSDYDQYFEIKPLAKDNTERLQAYLNKTQAKALEKNDGLNAIFCAKVQDYRKNSADRESDSVRLRNLELDNPNFKEIEKSTHEAAIKSFNYFKPFQKITVDEPLTLIAKDLDKKLCYGLHFKEKESFLTTYYFLPTYIEGTWDF